MTGAGAIGRALTGRSAAIAELAKPAVTAIDRRSFFIVLSALSFLVLIWERAETLPPPSSVPTIGEGAAERCNQGDTATRERSPARAILGSTSGFRLTEAVSPQSGQ